VAEIRPMFLCLFCIWNWSHIATYLVVVVVLVGVDRLQKKPKALSSQLGMGCNLAGLFFK